METVEAGVQEVHFTEKGNIYTYDNNGNKKKLGGDSLVFTTAEW